MKKFVNDPQQFVPEMLEGIALANPDTLEYVPEYNLIMRKGFPHEDGLTRRPNRCRPRRPGFPRSRLRRARLGSAPPRRLPAIGNAHGQYHGAPVLDHQRVSDLVEATGVPMALHGGTGLSEEQFKDLIRWQGRSPVTRTTGRRARPPSSSPSSPTCSSQSRRRSSPW